MSTRAIPHPGELDRRVTIQSVIVTKSSMHERLVDVADVADVWVKWQDLRGSELFAQGQMQQVADARCVMRWRSDLTAQHQIYYRGQAYAIVGQPIELGRRQYLELMLSSTPRERHLSTIVEG